MAAVTFSVLFFGIAPAIAWFMIGVLLWEMSSGFIVFRFHRIRRQERPKLFWSYSLSLLAGIAFLAVMWTCAFVELLTKSP